MTKVDIFVLSEVLKPTIERKNTTYFLVVLILVRVACTLLKLTYGANLIVSNKMFAIDCSTVLNVFQEVMHAINKCLR